MMYLEVVGNEFARANFFNQTEEIVYSNLVLLSGSSKKN